ncbi:hypothetical protein V8C86DRAFT_3033887 [Haematococcus lacustris]
MASLGTGVQPGSQQLPLLQLAPLPSALQMASLGEGVQPGSQQLPLLQLAPLPSALQMASLGTGMASLGEGVQPKRKRVSSPPPPSSQHAAPSRTVVEIVELLDLTGDYHMGRPSYMSISSDDGPDDEPNQEPPWDWDSVMQEQSGYVEITRFGVRIRLDKLQCLGAKTTIERELNDEIINMHCRMILEWGVRQRGELVHTPLTWVANTFFITKLLEGKPVGRCTTEKALRKGPTLDYTSVLGECELVLLPVHTGRHWTVVCVDLGKQRLMYLNSIVQLQGGDRIMNLVVQWLETEAKEKDLLSVRPTLCDGALTCIRKPHFSRVTEEVNGGLLPAHHSGSTPEGPVLNLGSVAVRECG